MPFHRRPIVVNGVVTALKATPLARSTPVEP